MNSQISEQACYFHCYPCSFPAAFRTVKPSPNAITSLLFDSDKRSRLPSWKPTLNLSSGLISDSEYDLEHCPKFHVATELFIRYFITNFMSHFKEERTEVK